MNTNVKEALNNVLELFENGDLPQAIRISKFPACKVPSQDYSYLNRLIIAFSKADNNDCRGYRQWQHINRYVKKDSKAVWILVPIISKREEEDETLTVKWFKGVPLFKVQDTDGEPLSYQELKLPDFPAILTDTAKMLGVSVKPISGNDRYLGAYHPGHKEIRLASPDELVFFHELGHAVDDHLRGIKGGQHSDQEIIAELTATVLSSLVGVKTNYGRNWQYISDYANGKAPITACLEVLSDVENVLSFIFGKEAENV